MRGNSHVRFLGGLDAARHPAYPTLTKVHDGSILLHCGTKHLAKPLFFPPWCIAGRGRPYPVGTVAGPSGEGKDSMVSIVKPWQL